MAWVTGKKRPTPCEILSEKSAEAYTAYQTLLDLDLNSKNWARLLENADRAMAINPFLKNIHYCRGCACEEMNQPEAAITSFEKLLNLKPVNPSGIRFRLARLHQPKDTGKAKRYVLDALADSPRYREAYRLLLSLDEEKKVVEDPFGGGGAINGNEKGKGPAPSVE